MCSASYHPGQRSGVEGGREEREEGMEKEGGAEGEGEGGGRQRDNVREETNSCLILDSL